MVLKWAQNVIIYKKAICSFQVCTSHNKSTELMLLNLTWSHAVDVGGHRCKNAS